MNSDERVLIGKKGKDEFEGWLHPPNTWTTVFKMWFENGEIKVWKRKL